MAKILIDTDELLTVEEAAFLLKKGVATIWRRLRSGELTPIKVGNRTVIARTQVEKLVNEQKG